MRTHTNEFKEELKVFGRQIQGKIIYYPSYDLVSESDDNILTEADLQIISEQANYDESIEINEEDIFSISIIKNGDLLQSLMKEFDFESKIELNIGSVVNPQFGLLVNEDYEYLNYGNYIINSKEFNMDTETWSYVCYDKMLFSMVKYKKLSNIEYPITIKQFINKLCDKVGLEFEDNEFVNQDQLIYEDLYENRDVTYRDIFDEISKIVAGNLLINDNDKLEVGYPKRFGEVENASGSNISIEAEEGKLVNVQLEGDTQQNTSILPSGYTQVDYIQSSGTQYIDTGLKLGINNGFDIKFLTNNTLGTNNYGCIFGGRNRSGNKDYQLSTFGEGNSGMLRWGSYDSSESSDAGMIQGIIQQCSLKNRVFTFCNGVNTKTLTNTSGNSDYNAYLFGLNNGGNFVQSGGGCRIYYLKLYDGNTLVRDFIPCYRNSDNEIGMYDLVNNVFYTNQGTGAFTYGSVVNIPNPNYPQDINVVTGEQNITISQNGNTQNYSINLGNIELCKIGDYQDYIYYNNGWYLHKETNKFVLNGTQNITAIAPQNNTTRVLYTGILRNYQSTPSRYPCLSNMFKHLLNWSVDNEGIYTNGNDIVFRINKEKATTKEEINQILSQMNLEVLYSLKNPQDTQITNTTLIQQLNNLKNATLYNGVNNINVDGDLPTILNLDYISEYEKINEDYLKDTNVKISEKIGVINSVAILDSDNNLQYVAEDTQSIKANEMTRITITDNLIAMNGETQEIADNILNKLNGLYYYANDLQTTGVCYYDFLDMFNVEARGNIYQCLLLNNEITITQGIEEHIFTEKLEELETSKNEYTTSIISNKAVQFRINQQKGEIESKVEKDGVISAINQSAEEIQIKANKISLEGKEINLTSDNVVIKSTNFSVDRNGNLTCNDATMNDTIMNNATANNLKINGGKINLTTNYYSDQRITLEYNDTNNNRYYKNAISPNGMIVYDRDDNNKYAYYESSGFNAESNDGIYQLDNYATGISIYKNNYSTINISGDGNITCVSLTQTSLKEKKKNFERLKNAKEILNTTDIYKYHFKEEDDSAKKSIGFVIGDDFNYSQEITSENNDGANIYSMVSVLWQVVKEQQEEINELKEMIKYGKY